MTRSEIHSSRAGRINCLVLAVIWLVIAEAHRDTDSLLKPEYFIDVLVVADFALYSRWLARTNTTLALLRRVVTLMSLRRYLTIVISEVNSRFRTLEKYNNFRLSVRPVAFYIAETPGMSTWTEAARVESGSRHVDVELALNYFRSWITAVVGLPHFDHAMLFTGYDLVTINGGRENSYATGRAAVGTLCSVWNRSASIVEERGAFQSVLTAAHELAHSLNARHDGTGNTCRMEDRYIMAARTGRLTSANRRNPWFFSRCSAHDISTYVTRLLTSLSDRQCLLQSLPQYQVPDISRIVPGQIYQPNEQCQLIYGPRSRYCHGGNFGNLTDICTSMFCLDTNDSRTHFCVKYHAAHGTSCDTGKWCEEGACVVNPRAPSNLGPCPVGDQLVRVNGRLCSELTGAEPWVCYDQRVANICCESCANIHSGVQSCPYGDRRRGCHTEVCFPLGLRDALYPRDCCGTCTFHSSRWTCADVPLGVDGIVCEEIVRRELNGCHNVTVASMCCQTCSERRDVTTQSNKGGKNGDVIPEWCRNKTSVASITSFRSAALIALIMITSFQE